MSTNKTQNYQLHSWTPQDEFHLTEINENFTALDTVLSVLPRKLEAVAGSYTGNGAASRLIDLGKKPVAVFTERVGGFRHSSNMVYGGLATRQAGLLTAMVLSDTGFTVFSQNYMQLNEQGSSYNYIAFFSQE